MADGDVPTTSMDPYDLPVELQTNRQIEDAAIAHLLIVENVRQGDPAAFRVLDITGDQLLGLMGRKREKHYFEVPFPVAVCDEQQAESI